MKPELCDHCGKATWYAPEASCRACDWPASLRAPNVQIAKAEQRALYRRYEQARDRAEARGCAELFSKLEQVAARSKAVVTVGSHFAYHFLNSEKEVYSPYGLLVGAMVRAPYSLQADRQRRVVESWLFGQYADQIVYASLSSDGTGLASYGLVHMTLDERTIAHRASVLEENSVTFARRYLPGSPPPKGYRSTWSDRGRLAAAKLEPKLVSEIEERDLPTLLLNSGERYNDEFLEVHIYGSFNWQAVAAIRVTMPESSPLTAIEQTLLKALELEARKKGIDWQNGF